MELFYLLVFGCLYTTLELRRNKKNGRNTSSSFSAPALNSLKNSLLLLVFLAMVLNHVVVAVEWLRLQRLYVYYLYTAYCFGKREVRLLVVAGFVSSMMLGAIIGLLANKQGRIWASFVYCIICILSCINTQSSRYKGIITGHVLGGIFISLFSAFNLLLTAEHMYPAPSLHNFLEAVTEFPITVCCIKKDFLSHQVDRDEIMAGDHIYCWRKIFAYSHHGIYVGENMVVHYTTRGNDSSRAAWTLSSCFPSLHQNLRDPCLNNDSCNCGFQQPGSGVVLSCFIGNGSVYLFQYGLKPHVYISKLRGGTCTIAKSDSPQEVIRRAMYLLENGFGIYNVARNNCEDFALYCKTGLLGRDPFESGSSGQVNGWANVPLKFILFATLKGPFCTLAAAFAAIGLHCLNRYMTDVGVRDDVVEVKVEAMQFFRYGSSVKDE